MALITKKSIYGLMAIYELYKSKEDSKPLQLKDVSKATNVSQNYLEQIFIELKKANLVYSIRGAKGGYKISKNEREILIKDIITVLDGEICTIKNETINPIFNLFFDDCDKQLVRVFEKPLSFIEEYEQKLIKQINYSI
ncbi:MAG: Rrf2 family transcriptional regulator [Sulfurospirillum sp.]